MRALRRVHVHTWHNGDEETTFVYSDGETLTHMVDRWDVHTTCVLHIPVGETRHIGHVYPPGYPRCNSRADVAHSTTKYPEPSPYGPR